MNPTLLALLGFSVLSTLFTATMDSFVFGGSIPLDSSPFYASFTYSPEGTVIIIPRYSGSNCEAITPRTKDGLCVSFTMSMGRLTCDIPDTVNGFHIPSILEFAPKWCTNLTNVTISDRFDSKWDRPSGSRAGVTNLILTGSMSSLRRYESYKLPSNVTNKENFAFAPTTSPTIIYDDSLSSFVRTVLTTYTLTSRSNRFYPFRAP